MRLRDEESGLDLHLKTIEHVKQYHEYRKKTLTASGGGPALESKARDVYRQLKSNRPTNMPQAATPSTQTVAPPPPSGHVLLPGMARAAPNYAGNSGMSVSPLRPTGSSSAPWTSKPQTQSRKRKRPATAIDGRLQCSGCGAMFKEIRHKLSEKGPKCKLACHCGSARALHPSWMIAGPGCDGSWKTTCPGCGQPPSAYSAACPPGPNCKGHGVLVLI